MPFDLSRTNVMIDQETVSTYSDAGILSIGAVKFNQDGIIDEFYRNIKFSDIKKYGLHVDKETLKWWKEQNPEALAALFKDAKPLEEVLQEFRVWYGPKSLTTWSKGASFDLPMLQYAHRRVAEENEIDPVEFNTPWLYYHGLCCRTVFEMFKELELEPKFEGTTHNALHDAKHQAQWMINCWKAWIS